MSRPRGSRSFIWVLLLAACAARAEGELASAWAELRAARDSIAADLEAGSLREIHEKALRLPALAQTLLERSADLAPDRRARVEGVVRQLPRLADALHDAADRGDATEAATQLKRLDGLLELIRAQYPSGTLPEATLDVKASDFAFEPRILEIRAGTPTGIELQNAGTSEHDLVVRDPEGERDWIHLHAPPKGKDTGTYRIDRPGRYRVACTVPGHEAAGMIGELVVKAR